VTLLGVPIGLEDANLPEMPGIGAGVTLLGHRAGERETSSNRGRTRPHEAASYSWIAPSAPSMHRNLATAAARRGFLLP